MTSTLGRGLVSTQSPHADGTPFRIDFDFLDHRLRVSTADGRDEAFPLVDGSPWPISTGSYTSVSAGWGSTSKYGRHPSGSRSRRRFRTIAIMRPTIRRRRRGRRLPFAEYIAKHMACAERSPTLAAAAIATG